MFSSSVSCLFKWFKLTRLWVLVTGVFFLAVTAIPVSAAVVISVPATDEDGTYTVSWTGLSQYVYLYERFNGGVWRNIAGGGITSKAITGNLEGTYDYRVDNYCQTGPSGPYLCNSSTGTVVVGTPSPIVAAIPDISINEDVGTQAAVNVTYGGSSPLQYSAVSSNPALITNASLVFSGSGYSKNLSITPVANASGQATITVTVTAGTKSTTRQFLVIVNSVDDAPVISAIANQSLNEGATANISFSITDVDSAVGTPTVSSSNTSAVSVSLSSPSVITLKAGPFTAGTQATITISVPGATRTFTVTLNNLDPELWIEPSGSIGEYNLRWNYGTHYVKIFENGVDVTQALTNSAHAGIMGNRTVSKTANGTFNYYLKDCNGGTNPPTCSGTYSPKSITVTFPQPVVNASVSASTINEGGTTTLTWSSTNATNCSATNISGVTGTSGTKTFTAPSVMSANQIINIVVTCTGNGGSVSKTVPVTVNAVNDKPLLTVAGTVSATEDTSFTIPFTFSDEETASADLTITAVSSDTSKLQSVTVDKANSRLNVVPVANANGSVSITIRVTDAQGLYEEKVVSVAIAAVDDAPVISAIANQSLNEGATANISFSITDVDSAVGTPTVSSSNTSAVSVSLSSPSVITLKAGPFTAGTQATITISVPGATRTFTVTLNNLDPELWIEPSGSIGEYNLRWNYGTHYVKIFENGVDVTQALTNSAHAGIMGNRTVSKTANGTFNYYLKDCNGGTNPPTCSGTYSPKSITVTFPQPVVNASVSASTINEGGTTTLTWSSTNATNCSATNISGVTGTSGTKTFTAPSVMSANQIINIVVTCTGNGGSVSKTVPVTVNAVNDKPLLTVAGTVSATEDTSFTIPFTFSDEETASADLTITAVSSDTSKLQSVTVDKANSRLNVVPVANANGSVSITIRVTDAQGLYEEKVVSVAIAAVDDAPIISAVSSHTMNESSETQINFTVSDIDSSIGDVTANGSAGITSVNADVITLGGGSYALQLKSGGFPSNGVTSSIIPVTVSVPYSPNPVTHLINVTVNNLNPAVWIVQAETRGVYDLKWKYGSRGVKIFENGNDITSFLSGSEIAPASGIKRITKTVSNIYNYYIKDCITGQNGSVVCDSINDYESITVSFDILAAPTLESPPTSNTGEYSVTWGSIAEAMYYELYENGVLIQHSSRTNISFSGTTRKSSGTYRYQVKACHLSCSEFSNTQETIVSVASSAASSSRSSSGLFSSSMSSSTSSKSSSGASSVNRRVIFIHTDLLGSPAAETNAEGNANE